MAPSKISKTTSQPKARGKNTKTKQKALPNVENLHFLWECFRSNNGNKVDYNKLSEKLGESKHKLSNRFWRLKNYFEDLQVGGDGEVGADDTPVREVKKEAKKEAKKEVKEEEDYLKKETGWSLADSDDEA